MKSSLVEFVGAACRLFGYDRSDGSADSMARSSTRLGYRLIVNGPVVVADYESNTTKSDYCTDQIVGGHIRDALKEAFAATNNHVNDDFYDHAVFTNALWARSDAPYCTVPMPLSVAVAKVGAEIFVVDAAACEDAKFVAMGSAPEVLTMGQFEKLEKTGHVGHMIYRPSWKDQHKEAAEQVFAKIWQVPSAESQRLKMSASIAKNSRQSQRNQSEPFEQQVWLGDIDLSGVAEPQRKQALKRLSHIFSSNEIRLGASKTPVKFELCAQAHKAAISLPQKNKLVRILLVSAAPILPNTVAAGGTNSFTRLQQYYQDYFSYISNGLLQLTTYYASQRMAGGEEYQRHFGRNALQYRPELLTEEGSVFVLRRSAAANDAEIAQLLQNWSDRGLPRAEERACQTWRNHPFVRENGYSEVRISYPVIAPQIATKPRRILR